MSIDVFRAIDEDCREDALMIVETKEGYMIHLVDHHQKRRRKHNSRLDFDSVSGNPP